MGDTIDQNSGDFVRRDQKTKQLTYEQRNEILQFLLQHKVGQKLSRGAIKEAAKKFDVTRLSVSRIWQRAKEQYDEGSLCADVTSKKKGNCGRKRKNYSENLNKLRDIPFNGSYTIRSLSASSDIPRSTLYRIIKEGRHLKQITPAVKPLKVKKSTSIQQEKSKVKAHSRDNDEDPPAEGSKDELNIQLQSQPPSGSDLNALDLGFFSSIQSQNAFSALSREKLGNIFLSLQKCMVSALMARGNNQLQNSAHEQRKTSP